jgi:hypothetical protein
VHYHTFKGLKLKLLLGEFAKKIRLFFDPDLGVRSFSAMQLTGHGD